MRPRILDFFAWIILGWGIIATGNMTAAALESAPTTVLPNSPIIITAYSTFSAGVDIDFVEIYNTSNVPIDITSWRLHDKTNDRYVDFETVSTEEGGLLLPDQHTIIAQLDSVTLISYEVKGWDREVVDLQKITKLSLENDAYKHHEVIVDSVKNLDQPMIRSYGVESYLSTFKNELYRPLFNDPLYFVPVAPKGLYIVEIYPYASNCSPFDSQVLCSDYVKLFNANDAPVSLDGIVLRTDSGSSSRTASNTISLGGQLGAGEYASVYLTDDDTRLSLTNSGGFIWLEDAWGISSYHEATIVEYESAGSTKQGYAYAYIAENDTWGWTITPNPVGPNVMVYEQEFVAECPVGKYRNPETGRCRTIEEAVNSLAMCAEGEERNPATNRCRKIVQTSSGELKPCGEGQERNPLTNRCRSIASAVAELLPCDEGYERNPATNRCRKVTMSAIPDAEYPVQTIESSVGRIASWWLLGGVAAAAGGYAVWEWRREITSLIARMRRPSA
ncbi:lamin tail domain-containing protein [Candidatus Saccharibacteria bacterium]|nr:lamin tail domain-containing protein [Candidatus Saccharibacteria bacterium]